MRRPLREDDAERDSLAGIFSVRRFNSDLESGALCDGLEVAYVLADLDQFKKVNDAYGYLVGDVVLRRAAELMTARCSNVARRLGPYRTGGESFGVVLIDADVKEAVRFAESIRLDVARLRLGDPADLRVTARFAVVVGLIHERDFSERRYILENFLAAAHQLLYCHPKDKRYNKIRDTTQL